MPLAPQELRTYFCTFSTAGRRRLFQVTANADLLLATLQHYRVAGRYELHAYVVMPDHVHLLLTPAPDVSLEKALQFIRGGFSFRLRSAHPVWERGHFDKRVPEISAYRKCVVYIEANPVEARLCVDPAGYPHSSAHASALLDPASQWLTTPEAKASDSENPNSRGLKPAATPKARTGPTGFSGAALSPNEDIALT